jgi:hypothetical protein
MNKIIAFSTVALGIGLAWPGPAIAQTAKDLVGTWTNVANVNIRQDGTRVNVFGPNGKGLAIFDSNGRFAIVNVNPDTPKFAANNRAQGTPTEIRPRWKEGSRFSGLTRLAPTKASP